MTVSPNFASKWLVPRLGSFSVTHPNLDLRISASLQHVDFSRQDVNLAVRHGTGDWPELHVTRLCAEELFPACSPSLLQTGPAIRMPADLAKHVLVHDRSRKHWHDWLAAFRIAPPANERGPVFRSNGAGNRCRSCGPRHRARAKRACVARPHLRTPGSSIAGNAAGSLCLLDRLPQIGGERPKISQFRSWLVAQVENDKAALLRRSILRDTPPAQGRGCSSG